MFTIQRTSFYLYNDACFFSLYCFVDLSQHIIYGPLHTTRLFSCYRIIIIFESESFMPDILEPQNKTALYFYFCYL